MQATTSNNAFECPVCFERFNDSDHAPKSLPCGHSCCLECANNLFVGQEEKTEDIIDSVAKPGSVASPRFRSSGAVHTDSITCPICRGVSPTQPTFLHTNYGILNAMPSVSVLPTPPVVVNECSMCKKLKRPVAMRCQTCNSLLCLTHSETHHDDHEDHVLQSTVQTSGLIYPEQVEIYDFLRRNTSIRESNCLAYSGLLRDANAHTISRLKNKLAKNSEFLSLVSKIDDEDDVNEIKQALNILSLVELKSSDPSKVVSSSEQKSASKLSVDVKTLTESSKEEKVSLSMPCRNELDCRRVIVDILKQTRGAENWNGPDDDGNRFNWSEELPLGEWNGNYARNQKRIQVDGNGMMTRLNLNKLGMRGMLPDSIGSLTSLTYLGVCNNPITSTQAGKDEVRRRFGRAGLYLRAN